MVGIGDLRGEEMKSMSYLPLGCSKAVSETRIPEHVVYLEGDPKTHRQGIEAGKESKPVRGAWSSPWPQWATGGPAQWGPWDPPMRRGSWGIYMPAWVVFA